MSTVHAIRCDADPWNCGAEDTPPGDPRTFAESRTRLARSGWHRTSSGRDICPDCWDAGKRPTA